MFRDRTKLFISFRRTIPRNLTIKNENRFDSLLDEEEGLIESRRTNYRDNNNSIEMKQIIPSIFEISKELDDIQTRIRQQIDELNSTYKKLIIVTKSEKEPLETKIENLNYQVLKNFEKCYVLIKKFQYLHDNHEKLNLNYKASDLEILNNYKRSYATKLQQDSLVFRNLQNNYIKFLKDDEDESSGLLQSSEDQNLLMEEDSRKIDEYSKQTLQQQQQHSRMDSLYLQAREKEISNIAMGILEISTIFKEMETLVIDQGSLLDRIDYNLQNTVQDLKSSDKELIKAKSYQKRTTKCKIIFLLILVTFALFILVLVKPHGSTKVVTKPATSPRPEINKPNDNEQNTLS